MRVLVPTLETPLMTESCLRTLKYWNRDVPMEITLYAPAVCSSWARELARTAGAEYLVSAEPREHGAILTDLVQRYNTDCLLLDSDVTFHGPGLLADMIAAAGEGDYCVGPDEQYGIGMAWMDPVKYQWGRDGYVLSRRAPIHCLLLKNSTILQAFVREFGFFVGMSSDSGLHGKYWDTGGLLMCAMRALGHTEKYVPNESRSHHWQSMSWMGPRYLAHEPVLRKIIEDHPWF